MTFSYRGRMLSRVYRMDTPEFNKLWDEIEAIEREAEWMGSYADWDKYKELNDRLSEMR